MKNKILWPVLFLCTLPVQAQQDMTEAEGSVTLQECLSRGLESNFSIRMVKPTRDGCKQCHPGQCGNVAHRGPQCFLQRRSGFDPYYPPLHWSHHYRTWSV